MGAFIGKLRLAGFFATLSGISIGRDKTGTNNKSIPRIIVRHPITAVPFIPASSFRGALRRIADRQYHRQGALAHNSQECPLCHIFGTAPGIVQKFPGCVTFRDVVLTEESVAKLLFQNLEAYSTEIKIYANMDRVTSQGNSYAVEQIPAGVHFKFDIFYNIYRRDDVAYFVKLLENLQELELFSLGSHSSRGLGKIRFGKWRQDTLNTATPQRELGLSLNWYPKKYYETGSEVVLTKCEENLGIEEMIQYEQKIMAAL